jgi:hypothetical protein
MLNILGHKRNANQNDTEILPNPHQSDSSTTQTKLMLMRMWGKKEYFYTVGRNVN